MQNVNGDAASKKYIIETTGSGVAILDYDRDGWPDILLLNGRTLDGEPSPVAHPTNHLYRNNHDGTFKDVTAESGLTVAGWAQGVCVGDYDNDGYDDIYITYYGKNRLYHNERNGAFKEVAGPAGVSGNDGDGWPDIFKTNFSDDTSSLYQNNRDGTFTAAIADAGLGLNTQYLGWGTMFVDVDNSGLLDILIANGHVYPQVDYAHLGSSYREPRLLYQNLGNGKFKDISKNAGPGCTKLAPSRGLAIADFWNEGRLSAVINNIDEKPMLLVNVASNRNHWLGVVTQGTRSNRDGIGAQVTVVAGGRKWLQEVRSGSSYISSSDLRLHFGLGTTTAVDHIEVLWPNGEAENFTADGIDRFITLVEGSGSQKPAKQ